MLHTDHTASESQLSARAGGTRRAEIEDFIQFLEEARALVASGSPFALALFAARPDAEAAPRAGAEAEAGGGACHGGDACHGAAGAHRPDALKEAHDFLGLNLRRRDSVAFYGPTLLAALLPCGGARRGADDLVRLLAELRDARPHARLAFGLASFPADGADIETLVGRAEAALDAALAGGEPDAPEDYPDKPAAFEPVAAGRDAHGPEAASGDGRGGGRDGRGEHAGDSGARDAAESDRPAQEFLPLGDSGARSSAEWRVPEQSATRAAAAKRGRPSDFPPKRAIRESKHRDDYESVVLPYAGAASNGVLASAAAEAAARERELRSTGARMPRRILLAVSDAARMAQINLLLRAAAYEVRAAFDGKQVLDLLRIERADLLVLDCAIAGVDGLEVLRRLDERHGGRLPLPVVLLVPGEGDGEELRGRASRLGAGGFVPLPYDPRELLERVRTSAAAG